MVAKLAKGFVCTNGLKRYCLTLLAVSWIGMQVGCWYYYQGPHLMGDGKMYLLYAQKLVSNGTLVKGHYRYYSGYIVFIALFLKLGLGLRALALMQVVLSGVAAIAFYSTASRLTKQHWPSAALVTAAWISWLSVQACNPFILTESLFTSCLVLCLWALVHLHHAGSRTLLPVLLLWVTIIRPNGFVALLAASLAALEYLWSQNKQAWALAGLVLVLGLGVIAINQFIRSYDVLPQLAAGTIIFGYEPARVKPAVDLVLPSPRAWPILQLGLFMMYNFKYFWQLCALKVIYFLGYPRPWYSFAHRVWAFVALPLVYTLAVLGAMRRQVAVPVRLYLVATLIGQVGIIMLTTEDWDSRFSAPFIAYWLQLAILGLYPMLKRWLPAAITIR